jgi:hypothetical protein
MTGGEWLLQAVLGIGLFLVLPAAFKLERALTAFRRDRASLEQTAQQLTDAIKDAEVAIGRLRDVSRGTGQRISEQVEHVDAAIRDIEVKTSDLQLMMDRAEALAGRLERNVRQKPVQDTARHTEPAAAEEAGLARPRPSPAVQPRPAPAASPPHNPPSPPPPPPPLPTSATPTAALAMRRALDAQAGRGGNDTTSPRILAEQRVLHAIRGRTTKP